MEFNWNPPPKNGLDSSPFFTFESFLKYSVTTDAKYVPDVTCSAVPSKNTKLKNKPSPENGSHTAPKTAHLNLKVPYPRPSVLTREEQMMYLDLKQKFADFTPRSQDELKQWSFFTELHKKVAEEQEEYMKYLEDVAQQNADLYLYVDPMASKFIEEYVACHRLAVLKYPCYYTTLDTVSLVPSREYKGVLFEKLQTLLEMGIVPKAIIPKTAKKGHSRQRLLLDNAKLTQRYPIKGSQQYAGGKLPVVSEDKNAELLAEKYEVQIVVSSSSLQCLLDNYSPPYHRQWEMPCVVREHSVPTADGERKLRIVYVDKPFIGKNLSNYDRNLLYHRLAMKTAFLHPAHVSSYNFEKPDCIASDGEAETETVGMDMNDEIPDNYSPVSVDIGLFEGTIILDDLETFGTGTAKISSLNRKPSFGKAASESMSSNCVEAGGDRICNDLCIADGDGEEDDDDDDTIVLASASRPPSPIVSTDGQFDKKTEESAAGSAKRQSKRLSEKQNKTPSASDASRRSAASNRRSDKQVELDMRKSCSDSDSDARLVIDVQSPVRPPTVLLPSNEMHTSAHQADVETSELGPPSGCAALFSRSPSTELKVKTLSHECVTPADSHKVIEPFTKELNATKLIQRRVSPRRPHCVLTTVLVDKTEGSATSTLEDKDLLPTVTSGAQCSESVTASTTERTLGLIISETDKQYQGKADKWGETKAHSNPTSSLENESSSFVRSDTVTSSAHVGPAVCLAETEVKEVSDTIQQNVAKKKKGRPPKIRSVESVAASAISLFRPVAEQSSAKNATECSAKPALSLPSTADAVNAVEQAKTKSTAFEGYVPGRYRVARTPKPGPNVSTSVDGQVTADADRQRNVVPVAAGVPRLEPSANQLHSTVASADGGETASSATKSSQRKQFQSPLDQILSDQSRMFDMTVSSLSAIRPFPFTLLGPINPHVLPRKPQSPSIVSPIVESPVSQPAAVVSSAYVLSATVASTCCSLASQTADDAPYANSLSKPGTKSYTSSKLPSGFNVAEPADGIASSQTDSHHSAAESSKLDDVKCEARENCRDYTQPPRGNVAYDLWKIGNLKMIVRYTYHGVMKVNKAHGVNFVHLMPKLEYQMQHGVEQMTYSEVIRSWLALQLGRNSRLVRAHIEMPSSEIAFCDVWDADKFRKELPSFHPGPAVGVLNTVLEKLSKLDPGYYLASHMPGNPHVQIKKMTKSRSGAYDLHFAYRSQNGEKTTSTSAPIPWMPINPNVLLPYHMKYGRIPCTFEPKDTARVNTRGIWRPGNKQSTAKKRKTK